MKKAVCLLLSLIIIIGSMSCSFGAVSSGTEFLIGDWCTSDGVYLCFYDDETFSLEWGYFPEEEGRWSTGTVSGRSFNIFMDGSSILSLMSLMYGATMSDYHFEILKCNNDNFYLVQVYDNYTAEDSPCKLPFTRVGAQSDFSYHDDPAPQQTDPPQVNPTSVPATVPTSVPDATSPPPAQDKDELKTVRIYNNSEAYPEGTPKEEREDKLGGYYDDMLWGAALFDNPLSQIDAHDLGPSTTYYNLAVLCGSICVTACDHNYLKQTYNDLGFEDKNIFFYSYPASSLNRSEAKRNGNEFAKNESLSFSIASREMSYSKGNFDLLVINLKGTTNFDESFHDFICQDNKDFYGYNAWDWIYDFKEDVFAGLEDYYSEHNYLGNRPLKILISGHSLGGAGGNLVAAQMINELGSDNWYSRNTSKDDIFTFMFGALDAVSLTTSSQHPTAVFPIKDGYENIINIYNYLDTFGPNATGVYGFSARGNSMYGKFGRFLTYRNNMRNVINSKSNCATHEIVGYIHAVKNGWLKNNYEQKKLKAWFRCPVDVDVYCGNDLVCSVVGNEIVKESDSVDVAVENEGKVFIVPEDSNYRFIVKATRDGKMDYSVHSLDNTDLKLIDYQNVKLTTGKMMVSEVTDSGIENIGLYVIDENGNKTAKIKTDGTETDISDTGEDSRDGERSGFPWWGFALIIGGGLILICGIIVPIIMIRRNKAKQFSMPNNNMWYR